MKNLPLFLTLCLLCVGCDRVEQTVNTSDGNRILCGGRDCIETYVWYNDEIVFANYMGIAADSASIKHMRDSAETILKNLKSLK